MGKESDLVAAVLSLEPNWLMGMTGLGERCIFCGQGWLGSHTSDCIPGRIAKLAAELRKAEEPDRKQGVLEAIFRCSQMAMDGYGLEFDRDYFESWINALGYGTAFLFTILRKHADFLAEHGITEADIRQYIEQRGGPIR